MNWRSLDDSRIETRRACVTLCAAVRELEHVHRLEQARLLLRAARLHASGTAIEIERWRRRAHEELELSSLDGVEPPGFLRWCANRRRSVWPSAAQLERVAHEG